MSTLVSDCPYTVRMSEKSVLFGDWLWEQLNQRGWGISDFAERADVSPSSVSRWAGNKRLPDPPSCALIAKALKLDVDYVLERAGHRRGTATDLSAMDPRVRLYFLNFQNLPERMQQVVLKQLEAVYDAAEDMEGQVERGTSNR